MIKIEILKQEINRRPITNKKGKQMTIYTQEAYAHLPEKKYPVQMSLTLWPDDNGLEPQPHPSGNYTLDPKSVTVGRFGDLSLSPILKPIK